MIYDNRNIRRQNRTMPEDEARRLLRESEFGTLSLIDENGLPYGVPVNFAWDGGSRIYIHCAREGKKLAGIARHADVSFCIVGRVQLLAQKFATEYESVVVRGKASAGLADEEKRTALNLIAGKLSTASREEAENYISQKFSQTEVIRIDIETFSGKRRI